MKGEGWVSGSKAVSVSITGRDEDEVKVVMVGAFPPPVHGMAAVNAAVRDALRCLARLAKQNTLHGAPWGKRLTAAEPGEARDPWLGGRAVNSKIFLMEVV